MAALSRCQCGEVMTMEFEFSEGRCALCQADEALRDHEPRKPLNKLTHAEIDQLLGIEHNRRKDKCA